MQHTFLFYTLGFSIICLAFTVMLITLNIRSSLFTENLQRDPTTMKLTRKCSNFGPKLTTYICSYNRVALGVLLLLVIVLLLFTMIQCIREVYFNFLFVFVDIPIFFICAIMITSILLWMLTVFFLEPTRFASITVTK